MPIAKSGLRSLPVFATSIAGVWALIALIIGLSLSDEFTLIDANTRLLARERGASVFRLIERTREWNARHGGVYVLVTPYGEPNPHLKIPNRDVTTTTGQQLTMINPAYMTRQISELAANSGDVSFHITSLKPIREANAPDDWEREALKGFENGEREKIELVNMPAGPAHRYMAPLKVTRPCLRCHEEQGYTIGDIRGGISVTMPAANLIATAFMQREQSTLKALAVFLAIGCLASYALIRNRSAIRRLTELSATQEQTIHQRTEALEESRARYREMAELSSDWFWEQDENFRFIEFDDEQSEKSRPPVKNILGKTRWELPISGISPEAIAAHRADCEAHRPFQNLEYEITNSAGNRCWFSISGQPIFDANGNFKGYRGTGTDVTLRKSAEANLRLSASFLDATQDGVVVTDRDGNILDVNPSFCRLSGYTRDELLGHNPRMLKSGRQDLHFYREMWHSIILTGHWHGEIWNRRKNGEVFPELLTISTVKDLEGRISHLIGIFSDISALKDHQAKLDAMAHQDPLTGLPNRRMLIDRITLAIAQASRSKTVVAVAFIDLDGFKPVNDELGHDAGDELLKLIARRLSESIRGGDTAARLGGDEFVLVFVGLSSIDEVENSLERVINTVAEPCLVHGHSVNVTASMGVAIYPEDGDTVEALLQHADLAMYGAKEGGKNRYKLYRGSAADPAEKL